MEIFETKPENDEGAITDRIAHSSPDGAKAGPGEAHQQAVGQKGPEGARRGRIPNPPGGRYIPDDHRDIDPAEESLISLSFQPQKGEKGDKDKRSQWRHRPGSKK